MKLHLLIFSCVLFSCGNRTDQTGTETREEGLITTSDSISYEIFTVKKGYGFNILKNGKLYIHQPVIPFREGFQEFTSEKAAAAIASMIMEKLQNKSFIFLLEKREVDSLLQKKDIPEADKKNSDPGQNETSLYPLPLEYPKNRISLVEGIPVLNDLSVKQKWLKKGMVPFGGRAGALTFTIGSNIYIGGGEVKGYFAKDFWCYNTVSETWTCLTGFPGKERMEGNSFSIGDKGYWGWGQQSGSGPKKFLNDLYEYDKNKNEWHKKNKFPGTGRVDAVAFTINNKAYVGLGYDEKQCTDMFEYDPGKDKWKQIADFAGGPVAAALGISMGNRGLVVAGAYMNNEKFVYEYLPAVNKWERKKDMPGPPRYFLGGGAIDSNLFIAGGGGTDGGEIRYRDYYLFNMLQNEWLEIPAYPASVTGSNKAVGGTVNGKVYLGTGFDGNSRNDWNVFEYYFSIRKDTGVYNESVCYPLQYNDHWELYQECSVDDCFAGIAIRTKEHLGDFCYSSRVVNTIRTVSINENGQPKETFLFPRNHTLQTQVQPAKPVSIRLFFSRRELEESLQYCLEKTGSMYSLADLMVIQCNEINLDTEPQNNYFQKGLYNFITPQWYSYGYNADILVAEFPVSTLRSEFYLAVCRK